MRLAKFDWEKFSRNRFNALLIILMVLFVFSPFAQEKDSLTMIPAVPLFYSVAVIVILKSMNPSAKIFYATSIIVFGLFIFEFILRYNQDIMPTHFLSIFASTIRTVLFWGFFLRLSGWLLSTKEVTSDVVKGGDLRVSAIGIFF